MAALVGSFNGERSTYEGSRDEDTDSDTQTDSRQRGVTPRSTLSGRSFSYDDDVASPHYAPLSLRNSPLHPGRSALPCCCGSLAGTKHLIIGVICLDPIARHPENGHTRRDGAMPPNPKEQSQEEWVLMHAPNCWQHFAGLALQQLHPFISPASGTRAVSDWRASRRSLNLKLQATALQQIALPSARLYVCVTSSRGLAESLPICLSLFIHLSLRQQLSLMLGKGAAGDRVTNRPLSLCTFFFFLFPQSIPRGIHGLALTLHVLGFSSSALVEEGMR